MSKGSELKKIEEQSTTTPSKDPIEKEKKEHPEAEVIVHPECTPDVIALSDKVFSTTGMLNYAKKTERGR